MTLWRVTGDFSLKLQGPGLEGPRSGLGGTGILRVSMPTANTPTSRLLMAPWKLVHSFGELEHSHQKDPLSLTQAQR